MTYNDIRLQVYERLQFGSSQTGTVVETRIGRSINRWHRKILSTPCFRSFRRVPLTKASVADQWIYGVTLADLYYITERDNDRRITKRSEAWWRDRAPDPTADTGTPRHWIPLGYHRTERPPADASEIFVISTSASDNTQTAYVEVVRTDGHRRSLSVALNGTTAASLASAITDVVDVVDFYLSAAAVGSVTLREDSGTGTVLSTIPIGSSYPRYLRYALYPTPSAVITYYLYGLAYIVDMAQATDQPLIEEDFHDILVDGAVYDDWMFHGRLKEAQWIRDEIEKRIMQMRAWVWMQQVQDEGDDARRESFEDTISLPIT